METQLTTAPASAAVDLRRLDATLAELRRAKRAVSALVTAMAEARDAVVARPDDPEAARRITMTELRMRAEAAALTREFAALAMPES